jgi:hypothetical protein
MLNSTLRRKDVWRSGCTGPCFQRLGTSCVVFPAAAHLLLGNEPSMPIGK